jgi:hypothetical protein
MEQFYLLKFVHTLLYFIMPSEISPYTASIFSIERWWNMPRLNYLDVPQHINAYRLLDYPAANDITLNTSITIARIPRC